MLILVFFLLFFTTSIWSRSDQPKSLEYSKILLKRAEAEGVWDKYSNMFLSQISLLFLLLEVLCTLWLL